ncbi:hypothetical protein MSG28_014214 [Choristoneura fumiferana]|uniref:Uncharacterized protein n=1 Tax=Choristoneura fumiferana TaxID=7141 RepID=A0ACC0JGE9_CHOFU|nr:hypothetical protein MSG28_014214 [Choristoneura fumiferana]
MGSNIRTSTLLLIFVTFATVAAQTFQYSRGWTNGKRAHKRDDGRELAGNLEKILTPCQMNKLKYMLEGRPLNERPKIQQLCFNIKFNKN